MSLFKSVLLVAYKAAAQKVDMMNLERHEKKRKEKERGQ